MLYKLTCGNSYFYIQTLQQLTVALTVAAKRHKLIKYLVLGLKIHVVLFTVVPRNWL